MDTKDIRCFRLVYEERSIHKAAKQLFITPQGLSRIIQKLEGELQLSLFRRTTQGVVPTESGNYFYQQSQTLIYQLDDMKVKLQNLQDTQQSFRLGFSCGILNLLSLQELNLLQMQIPNARIQWDELENLEVIEQVRRGLLDLGVIIGTTPLQELTVQTLCSCKMNALVYPGHPFYEREQLSIRDLKDKPLITLNQKYFTYHSLIQRCEDFGFLPNIVITTMESQLLYRFCQEEAGIGIDADIHWDSFLLKDLHKVELYDAIPWKISLIYNRSSQKENVFSKVKRFLSLSITENILS